MRTSCMTASKSVLVSCIEKMVLALLSTLSMRDAYVQVCKSRDHAMTRFQP
jgi:hypothetical protein